MSRPHPILWFRAHPVATDGFFALILAIPTVASSLRDADNLEWLEHPSWWRILLAFATVAPVVLRRRHPVLALALVVGAQLVCDATRTNGSGWLGVMVATYSVGAHIGIPRRRLLVRIAAFTVAIFIVSALIDHRPALAEIGFGAVAIAGAFAIGDNMGRRRERVAELAERADRAEREQELLAHQRVAEERTRIAREMHDVVAHSVSMMTVQAAAARRQLHRNPDQAESALLTIEMTGRTAMDEMRRILGALRSSGDSDTHAPQPTLAMLPDLAALDADLPIQLDVDGDFSTIAASTQLAAYRVVQEALTNVRRHAGSVDLVEVSAHRSGRQLQVEVLDDGRGASALANGEGFGLIGMRERVTIVNGRLEAGPRSGGGWRVAALFDLDGGQA
jgi:signal transduction histidine kinase